LKEADQHLKWISSVWIKGTKISTSKERNYYSVWSL